MWSPNQYWSGNAPYNSTCLELSLCMPGSVNPLIFTPILTYVACVWESSVDLVDQYTDTDQDLHLSLTDRS